MSLAQVGSIMVEQQQLSPKELEELTRSLFSAFQTGKTDSDMSGYQWMGLFVGENKPDSFFFKYRQHRHGCLNFSFISRCYDGIQTYFNKIYTFLEPHIVIQTIFPIYPGEETAKEEIKKILEDRVLILTADRP